MKVDVVIVTYRSERDLERCLHSVPPGHSVFVVENASGDGSPAIAERCGARVIRNETNRGFAAAANQGASLGTGDLILFLNPDAVLSRETIDVMAGCFDRSDVCVVGANLVGPDGTPQRSWWPFPSPRQMWLEALGLGRLVSDQDGFVVGACFMVRRKMFDALGGFDQRYWLYGEEADLCFRAREVGWSVVLASTEVEHEGGVSGRDSSDLVAEHFARGSDRFVLFRGGRRAVVSYRMASLISSIVRWPLLRVLGRREVAAMRRRHVRRTARALLRHPTTVPSESAAPVPGVVVLSLEPWDEVWRRNQFLVRELLAIEPTLRVLWVEPPQDLMYEMLRKRRPTRLASKRLRPLPDEPRVVRFQPRKWLPRAIWPGVDRSLSRQVTDAMYRGGFRDAIVWVNDSTYAPLTRALDNRSVYDITDDWLDSNESGRELVRRERRERVMLNAADEVVVCSPTLAERRSALRDVHVIPNAVDTAHFRRPQPRPADLPNGRTAVYVGTLHDDRIDVELVEELAEDLPELQVVLVGPDCLSDASRRALGRHGNVLLLDRRPYSSVPGYLQHADVVVVPHLVSPFTDSLDPIKAYECLAVGTPTVATAVQGFRDLGGPIVTTEREGFSDAVRHALTTDRAEATEEPPSWRHRAEEFWAVLQGRASLPTPRRRVRVAYLDHTAIQSGGEVALARLLPGMPGVEPIVILGEDGPLRELLEKAHIDVRVVPMAEEARSVHRSSVVPGRLPIAAVVHTARYVRTIRNQLKEIRPDLVHTNSLKSALYGGIAARWAGVPVIWHIRDRIAPDYLPRPVVWAVRALALVVPDGIITNSNATRRTLARAGRTSAVAPSPVVYDAVPEQQNSATAESSEFTVGIIGRLAPWKGQDVFLRGFSQAFPNGDARALVVGGALFGEDEFERQLRELIEELGLRDRVTMTGHVHDVAPFLSQMDLVVHASVIPEPFGQVVVEAMMAGKPVIASAAGGPLEIVTDGTDGVLVAPGSPDALSAAMRSLAADPAERERLARNAKRRAADFAPARVGVQVERVYRKVLAAN